MTVTYFSPRVWCTNNYYYSHMYFYLTPQYLLYSNIHFSLLFSFLVLWSWSHLHPQCPEKPHQISAGGRLFLSGRFLRWDPHHRMELYVRCGQPHHRDMAARGLHQHNCGLQQQSAGLQQWLHGPVRPAAAGRRILRHHCHRSNRKQQRQRLRPQSKWLVCVSLAPN